MEPYGKRGDSVLEAAFGYPNEPHRRKHGPMGYSRYERYRPWLRDEYGFRCVYCRARERWGKGHYGFHVDHLVPQNTDPTRILDYHNLFHSCATCNTLKKDAEGLPDPCHTAYGSCVKVTDDGKIMPLDADGQFLIKVLRLDNDENTEYRHLILEILRLARRYDSDLYVRMMGYPEDLPDLASKRPPGGNSRPEGIGQSALAKRQRGEIEETY